MKWVIFTGIIFLTILSIHAQHTKYRFEHLTVNEGLSHSDAMAVVQDKNGFVWIGTNKGIDRYNGYELKKYQLPTDSNRSLSFRVRVLVVTPDGNLWAAGEGAGLYQYNPAKDQFRQVTASSPALQAALANFKDIYAISSDARGRIWMGTQTSGVFVLEINTEAEITAMTHVQLPNNAKRHFTVQELAIGTDGRVWIGTLGGGLWTTTQQVSSGKTIRAQRVTSLLESNIRGLFIDRLQNVWIAGDSQLYWYTKEMIRQQQLPRKVFQPFNEIDCIYRDSFDQVWVGTNSGLYQINTSIESESFDSAVVTRFLPMDNEPASINSGRIHQIMEDQFHNLWLAASAGGVNKINLRSKPFQLLQRQAAEKTALSNNYINSIYKDEKRDLVWMGTRNGFTSYDPQNHTFKNYLNWQLPGNVTGVDVSVVFKASDDKLWVGTRYKGLYTFSGENIALLPEANPTHSWYGTSIESITEDAFKTIWIATFNGGLFRYSLGGKLLGWYRPKFKNLASDRLTCLLADGSSLWISTKDAGVLHYSIRPDTLVLQAKYAHEPNNPHSLRVNYAWPLQKDQQGNLWIGTIGGGLHRLQTKTGRMDRLVDQVPETDVESILIDRQGHVWIGGAGLYDYNPKNGKLLHYDATDGLSSNAFKVGAACRGADGTLYFGSSNGVTYFQPELIQKNPIPPLIQITGLRIKNHSVSTGDTINGRVLVKQPFSHPQQLSIRHYENDFSIEFVGLDYISTSKHQYQYRLVGYNKDWVSTAPGQRMVSFTNLPSGSYTFLVKVSNGDGVWSAKPARLAFEILPPWWQTWWAYVGYALLIGLGLLLYRRFTLHQQALKNQLALEHFRYEKEKELTDMKLSFFTQVSHELRTPLTLILGPIEELMNNTHSVSDMKQWLGIMHQQTRKLVDLVNQLLDFRKLESGHATLRASEGDVVAFVRELYAMFELKAQQQQVSYRFHSSESQLLMPFDPEKLETILTNLLSNAFKFSPEGGRIELSLQKLGDEQIQIKLQDWGPGMAEEELDRIFDPYYQASQTQTLKIMGTGIGLSLVKNLVELHGGTISVRSTKGKGTTFTFVLPLHQEKVVPAEMPVSEPFVEDVPLEAGSSSAVSPGFSRIMVVEDDPEVRAYLSKLLAPAYELVLLENGVQAWEHLQNAQPDLILSDVMMPEMDGIELCKKIRECPKTAHLPVVLLTARTAAAHELQGLEVGADDYLTKPFKPQLLFAKINGILHNRLKLKTFFHRQVLLQPTEIDVPDADKEFIAKAMRIVEGQLMNSQFTVQDLVQEMGMSQSVFYRRMKATTGQSVIEFIRDVRMKRAAQLLGTTTYRISEVALMVGVEDPKNFRKMFQKLHGVSPSEYVRNRTVADSEEISVN